MDFSAAPEDEFHDWYDLEHIPERLRVPGFLNADRWIGTENPKGFRSRPTDLDDVGVAAQPALPCGRRRQTARPGRKRTAKFPQKASCATRGEQLFPGDRTAPTPGRRPSF